MRLQYQAFLLLCPHTIPGRYRSQTQQQKRILINGQRLLHSVMTGDSLFQNTAQEKPALYQPGEFLLLDRLPGVRQRRQKAFGRNLMLYDIGKRPDLHCPLCILKIHISAQDYNDHLRQPLLQLPGQRNPVQIRKRHIHKYDIRLHFFHQPLCLPAIISKAHDPKTMCFPINQRLDILYHQIFIIYQHHLQIFHKFLHFKTFYTITFPC